MINGNRIKFGYGDIGVHAGCCGNIKLRQFKPVQECGSRVDRDAVEWIGDEVNIGSSVYDMFELKKRLNQVKEQKCFEFEFDGYVFDFTNYNVESVLACLKQVEQAIRFVMRLMAC